MTYKNTQYFDRKVKGSSSKNGKRVFVRKLVLKKKYKLADKWDKDV